ncbi:hypothetical protein ABH909_004535 [Pseudomonas sp. BS3782 TE3695]
MTFTLFDFFGVVKGYNGRPIQKLNAIIVGASLLAMAAIPSASM